MRGSWSWWIMSRSHGVSSWRQMFHRLRIMNCVHVSRSYWSYWNTWNRKQSDWTSIEPSLVKSARSLKLPALRPTAAIGDTPRCHGYARLSCLHHRCCRRCEVARPALPSTAEHCRALSTPSVHPCGHDPTSKCWSIWALGPFKLGLHYVYIEGICQFAQFWASEHWPNIKLCMLLNCCRAKAWTPGESTTLGRRSILWAPVAPITPKDSVSSRVVTDSWRLWCHVGVWCHFCVIIAVLVVSQTFACFTMFYPFFNCFFFFIFWFLDPTFLLTARRLGLPGSVHGDHPAADGCHDLQRWKCLGLPEVLAQGAGTEERYATRYAKTKVKNQGENPRAVFYSPRYAHVCTL